MKYDIETVVIENFKSFREKTTIRFPMQPGLRLITGQNEVEPRLGANGVGKSTLWDAIVWCLYGTSARGHRASNLASWGSPGRPYVGVLFNTILVERYGNPDAITLDGKRVQQGDIDVALGMDKSRFLHSVVFGQKVPTFLDLSIADRGALLDEILDLELWNRCSERAANEVKTLDKSLAAALRTAHLLEGKLSGMPDTEVLRGQSLNWEQDNKTRCEHVQTDIAALKSSLANLRKVVIKRYVAHDFLAGASETKKCSKCGQSLGITEAAKKQREEDAKAHASEIRVQNHERNIQNTKLDIARLEKVLDELTTASNPHYLALQDLAARVAAVKQEIASNASVMADIEGEKLLAEYWVKGFRSVRLYRIQKAMAVLELEVANAASAMGLPGWNIKFVTETETKSGSIKPGVQIQVTSPHASGPWELWSGGEEQRIKLAVAVGMASMIQHMAGVEYIFEVWDEPTQWLSQEGINDLLTCLSQRADLLHKAVWLLDHRALHAGAFGAVWTIHKTRMGSTIRTT